MTNDDLSDTTYGGAFGWEKQSDGTYTKSLTIYYKRGRPMQQIIEENVSEKEYFKRKLNGTA